MVVHRKGSKAGRRAAAALLLMVVVAVHGQARRDAPTDGSRLTVGTFNVHYISERQDRLRWSQRKEAALEAVRDMDADIVAFQEMETFAGGAYNTQNEQLDFLRANLAGYGFAAVGDPAEYPSTQPIMFRRDRFRLLEQGFFFFSDTPDEIYSRSWDGRFPAYCSWARFADRAGGRRLYVYNVHLDAGSATNRLRASELIASRVAGRRHPDDLVVVAGDFNAPWYFPAVRRAASIGLDVADTAGSTYHFGIGLGVVPAIDHVLLDERLVHRNTRLVRKTYQDIYPSDHFPVVVELVLPEETVRE